MRDRHIPRLCRACASPLAAQEATCWSCDAQWATENELRTPLRVIPGGAPAAAMDEALPADRWADEGGRG